MIEDPSNEEEPQKETIGSWNSTASNNYSINLGGTTTTSVGWNCTGCGCWVGTHNYHQCPGSTYYRWYDYTPYVYTPYITVSTKSCPYCKAINHDTPEACSRVKSIKYREDGTIKSIKFHKDLD